MEILGVNVRAYLMSCGITMPLTIILVYWYYQDILLGLGVSLTVDVLSFFIIALIESIR